MGALISYDEVVTLVTNPPTLAPHPDFTNLHDLCLHLQWCPEPFAGIGYDWRRNLEMRKWCDHNLIIIMKLWLKNWMKMIYEWLQRRCAFTYDSMWYIIWSCELRWWASPPQMDLSPQPRVCIQGGHWVSNGSRFWSYDTDSYWEIFGSFPADVLAILRRTNSMIPWHVSHLLGSGICQNLWKVS